MQLKRSTIGLVAALLLAAVGGYLVYSSGGDDNSEASQEQVETVPVLVSVNTIPRNFAAADLYEESSTYVTVQDIPVTDVVPNALNQVEAINALSLAGNLVQIDIPAGTQLTPALFFVPGNQQTGALADVDPELFEVTVALESQRALGGNIFAGEYMGIVASFDGGIDEENSTTIPPGTRMVLESVLITNVETETLLSTEQLVNDPQAPTLATVGRIFVTFGVNVEQAERLVFANDFGRIWLARQNDQAVADDSDYRILEDLVNDHPQDSSVGAGN